MLKTWSVVWVLPLMLAPLFGCGDKKAKEPEKPIVCEFGKSGDPERCDGKDNDCDDDTDEYADTLCGTDCVAAPKLNCSANEFPPFGESWPEPDSNNSSDSIVLDKDGNITLGQTAKTYLHVWIANTVEGTVSKLDAETGKELARYPSAIKKGIQTAVGVMNHNAFEPDPGCGQSPYYNADDGTKIATPGNCPSRTAVDQNGQAYVANRAFSGQGTVTKFGDFGSDEEMLSNCDDRNNDGVIRTSHDADGNGEIDPNDPEEFIGTEDECILWTANVGGTHGVPRSLAVGLNRDGAPGWVWVGLNGGERPLAALGTRGIVALDPKTGAIAKRSDGSDIVFGESDLESGGNACKPYGAVTARDGRIWWVCRKAAIEATTPGVGFINAAGTDFEYASAYPSEAGNTYGITVDYDDNVYVTAIDSPNGVAYRYEPDTQAWTVLEGVDYGRGRGIAADREHLWVALSQDSSGSDAQSVVQYNLADLSFVKHHDAIGCSQPVGVGVSANGYIWAVCYGSANTRGYAAAFDIASGTDWKIHQVGINPYTYSDFTGFGLNSIAEPGKYRFIAQGCTGPSERTQWEGLVIDEGLITSETPVSVRARSASRIEALDEESFTEPISVSEIGQVIAFSDPKPSGMVLQIEILLSTNNPEVLPRIKSLQFVRNCYIDVP